MTALAAIHVAKRQLGLDDETYRGALKAITGKTSAGDMTPAEHEKVLAEFRRRGFKAASGGRNRPLEGRFAKKLQALWIGAWNLGLVRNRDDHALIAFCRRQTGIDEIRFLHRPGDAARVIEALKGWMARDAGVEWPAEDDARAVKLAIIAAQHRLLGDSLPLDDAEWPDDQSLHAAMQAFGRCIRARDGAR